MRFVKHYRRVTTNRALKPWTPVFTLDGHEATTTFRRGKVVRIPFPIRFIASLAFGAWLIPPPLGSIAKQLDRESLNELNRCRFGGVSDTRFGPGRW